ncbi:MAG: helix-turn-helix transcriptional regulator [Ilumatobacteraceae bacterium]
MIATIDRFAEVHGVPTSSLPHDGAGVRARWVALRAASLERPGVAFAEWVDLAMIGGVLPALVVNSHDVGDAVRTLSKFHALWGDDEVAVETRDDGSMRVSLRGPAGTAPDAETLAALLTLLVRVLDRVTGRTLALSRTRWLGADALELSAAIARTPLVDADPTVAVLLAVHAESSLRRQTGAWLALVREQLADAPEASLVAVAARLACSPRTLQARLQAEGTTFSEVVDDVRRQRVLQMLCDRSLSISEIALRTSFTLEGLSRAVRRWTGQAPSAWRAAHA